MGQIIRYYNCSNIYGIDYIPNKIDNNNHNTYNAENITYLSQNIGANVYYDSTDDSTANSGNARNAFVNRLNIEHYNWSM